MVALFVSVIFTDTYLNGIIRELYVEQEQRLQSILGVDTCDIESLNRHRDKRQRILEILKMWLQRTKNPNKTQLAEQLKGYF